MTSEGKTLWPMYRARKHEIILARWSPDYVDPHSNADAFAHNPDNRMEAKLTGVLAWRNAWADPAINDLTVRARNELDLDKREQLYLELQGKMQTVVRSPSCFSRMSRTRGVRTCRASCPDRISIWCSIET